MIKITTNQHFSLLIIGLPSFTHDFISSFISLKPTTFLFSWPSNLSPQIKQISLQMRGRLRSSKPSTIFFAISTIFMSSLDVWSQRIFCESYCFFYHYFSVSSSILACSSKWFFIWFINCILRPFIAEINSSKLFSASFTIFSLFSSTLKRTCLMSNSTFYVLSNLSIPSFIPFYLLLRLNLSLNEYPLLLLLSLPQSVLYGCQTLDRKGISYQMRRMIPETLSTVALENTVMLMADSDIHSFVSLGYIVHWNCNKIFKYRLSSIIFEPSYFNIFQDNKFMFGEHDSLKADIAANQQPIKPIQSPPNNLPKVKHIYLEEQNIYGRFIPYLLLKDELHSQMDSSGNSALHHMCSHNSPYLPLYLSTIKKGDPILNRKSNMGHTPLDVAGLYCNKQYIELLKQKGAIDHGQVDHWAIQGANLANWSGEIDPKKKFLIHWAAYNDLPQVISEYGRCGVPLSEPDTNGYTAMDLAVINKSYKTVKVLAELGERPQAEILKGSDSKSIKYYFEKLQESDTKKKMKSFLKLSTLPLFLGFCNYLYNSTSIMVTSLLCGLFWLYLLLQSTKPQTYMDGNRKTAFRSELLLDKEINRTNHCSYLLLHIFFISTCLIAVIGCDVKNYFEAFLFWLLIFAAGSYSIHLCVQIYGITHNLTYSEMFYSHEWSHLWKQISYIPERQMVIRKFKNPYDEGTMNNISSYL